MSRSITSPFRTVVLGAAGAALLGGLAVTTPAKADGTPKGLSCAILKNCFIYKPPLLPKSPKPGYGGPGFGPKFGPGFGGGPGSGFGPAFGAAMVGGMALGAIAASAHEQQADDGETCYRVRRRVVDDLGNEYIRHVTVCE